LKQWPELAEEAYYGLPGRIVRIIEPYTESDPVALLIQLIVSFGSVIGRSAHFRVEADTHYTNLFACLIGNTSKGRKGTSLGHVKQLFRSIDKQWEEERIQSGLSSGEGFISAIRDQIIKTEPIKKGGRVTDYQEIVTDPGIQDKRLLVVESEFASALRILGRKGNTLSPVLRNAWDGIPLQSMTKNSPEKCLEPHASIVAHVTMDEIKKYLTRTEAGNGFGNRFLFFVIRRSKCLPDGGRLPQEDIYPAIQELTNAVKFARQAKELKRDEEAGNIWRSVYPELSEGKSGMAGALIARAEAQVMRLACLYAVMDGSFAIKAEHLTAALTLWDYAEKSVSFVFKDASENPDAYRIAQALKAHPEGMTLTEISQDLFQGHRTRRQIAGAIQDLSRTGDVSSRIEKTNGRARTIYSLREVAKKAN